MFVYDVPGSKSSGARFYSELTKDINSKNNSNFNDAKIVLFNIYTPFSKLLYSRLIGKKVVLRVDGLWNDRLTSSFLDNTNVLSRIIFKLLGRIEALRIPLSHAANFFHDNYKLFAKVFISNEVVFQSNYSKLLHTKYYTKKNTVILNGCKWQGENMIDRSCSSVDKEIKMCLIYSRAPLKGVYESVKFVTWLNQEKNLNVRLYIIGYSGESPPNAPSDYEKIISNNNNVTLVPAFDSYDHFHKEIFDSCDLYLCLSRADPCPNALIESMSYGLPVLGIASGGVPEIVKDAGVLIPYQDFSNGYFFGSRYEYIPPYFSHDELYNGLIKIMNNYSHYRSEVRKRFHNELDLSIVSSKYQACLLKYIR